MRIDCWSTDCLTLTACGKQLSQGFWTEKRGLTLVCRFFKISGLRVVFLKRGFTIADLKAAGKRPECRESLMIRCDVWEKIIKKVGQKRCWQKDLVHMFLLWTDSGFSSLHLQRQIERHPIPLSVSSVTVILQLQLQK